MKKIIISTFLLVSAAHALEGSVLVDGSSTVFPVTEAVAEEFQKTNPNVRVMVGLSGTGGGMKKFVANEIDITGASRPITEGERMSAKKAGIDFIELPIAYDGLVIVVNPANTCVSSLSTEDLKKIWQVGSTVKMWSDVRPTCPKEKINLYGPGTDSGTFDYFTEVINGKKGSIRPDFTASEDDNVLVQGVSKDKYAMGYFGFAYWAENKSKLKALPIGSEGKAISPSSESISSGTYKPLSRPIFIYVNTKKNREEVKGFVHYYLENAPKLVRQVGYVPFLAKTYEAVKARFNKNMTGTTFGSDLAKKTHNVDQLVAASGI